MLKILRSYDMLLLMSLEIYCPQNPLSQYVHMFWAWDNYCPIHNKERILPHGSIELNINLSERDFSIENHAIDKVLVAGARSNHFVIDTSHETSLLSVWFKAGAGRLFFDIPANELNNSHIPLNFLWGEFANDFYYQLLCAPTTQMRFKIIERTLLQRLQISKQRPQIVDYAVQCLNYAPQAQTIKHIVDKIALSPTQFIHVFKEHVGLTPKVYSRVNRFQFVLNKIASQSQVNWADIALSSGYYDQSHLINEFRAFAGITPSDYVPQDPEHLSNIPYFDET